MRLAQKAGGSTAVSLRPIAIGGWLADVLRLGAFLVAVGATLVAAMVALGHVQSAGVAGSSSGSSAAWLVAGGIAVGGWVVGLGLAWAGYVLECLSELELRSRLDSQARAFEDVA